MYSMHRLMLWLVGSDRFRNGVGVRKLIATTVVTTHNIRRLCGDFHPLRPPNSTIPMMPTVVMRFSGSSEVWIHYMAVHLAAPLGCRLAAER